jgi:D-xylono/L-arabinono-1,4-lactonase
MKLSGSERKDVEVTCVHSGICHLGEGPVWNRERQRLFWTDIFERRIWTHDPQTGASEIFWRGELRVGGFAFTRTGDLVLCTDHGVFRQRADPSGTPQGEPELMFRVPLAADEMFNDITTDPAGRIFAGTLDRSRFTGTLYRFERGVPPAAVLRDLRCSNGMTFSLDEQWFFHTDTLADRITRFRYRSGSGEIDAPLAFYEGSGCGGGLPDGITMDRDGCIWAAFWGGSEVRRIDQGGRVIRRVSIPARQPSSVMFGGPALDRLYVTSAAQGAADLATGLDRDGVFLGGPVYQFSPGTRGREEWPADF